MTDALPTDVRELLVRHLPTMEHVEALLTLAGAESRDWTAGEVAARTHTTPGSVSARLEELLAAGVVSAGTDGTGTYRYSPRTPELRRAVTALDEMYRTKPVTLIKAIYDRPPSAVQSFADAFRIRKPES